MRYFWMRGLQVFVVLILAASVCPRAQARTTSGSTTNADGTTTTITKNPDGTTTRTVTDADGNIVSNGNIEPEPVTHAAPRQPGTSGSTTNPDGTTTTVTKNPDGTTTRTITDANGNVVSSGNIEPEPVTHAAPRQPGTSGSTTNADGTTTTITKNPDGTTTRTVTDKDGNVVSSGKTEPEPVTHAAPRQPGSSASTTDADGNTVTIELRPDGTRVRTVTSPDGKVLKTEPINAAGQMLYNSAKEGDCTVNTALVLKTEGGRTLLEASVLPTGKGTNFRTWVPERINLILGKDKLKPVSTQNYYVEKEAALNRLAPVLFAAIAADYAMHAREAESKKGTVCPITGKVEEDHKADRGKFGRAIDEASMVAGLSTLASQAKGQIEGRRVTFDVTGREKELQAANLLVRASNTDTSRINISNELKEVEVKVPVGFKPN